MNFIFLLGQALITGVNGIPQVKSKKTLQTSNFLGRDAGIAVTKLMQENSWKKVLLVYR